MTENAPSTQEWKKLYELMDKVRGISPWDWLEEDDIFAVQDPETEKIGFVSVMGAIGEHYSIAVYRGEKGLLGFWDFHESDPEKELAYQKLFEIPHIQASFEDRKYLFSEDKKIIKKLGLTYRGRDAWPMFRRYRPGFVPWFITSADAKLLICVLEQTVEVSLGVKTDADMLYPDDQDGYLLRKRINTGNRTEWRDFIWHETKEPAGPVEFFSDMIAFNNVRKLQNAAYSLEMELFMSPHAVSENEDGPYYPYILLMVETGQGLVLGHELIFPLPNLETMWQKMPSFIARALTKLPSLPAEIYISSDKLYESLVHMKDYLNSSVRHVEKLFLVPEVIKSFLDFNSPR